MTKTLMWHSTLATDRPTYRDDTCCPEGGAILLTSRHEPEERERSRAVGFDTHLRKPVSPNRVTQTLRPLLATAGRLAEPARDHGRGLKPLTG